MSPNGTQFFEHLNKAVALADKVSNGERLLILSAQAGANGNVKGVKEDLDQLVAAYPNDERAHFALGGWYFGQNQYPEAIEQYRKATELNPSYGNAWDNLAAQYLYAKNYDGALAAAEKAPRWEPRSPSSPPWAGAR